MTKIIAFAGSNHSKSINQLLIQNAVCQIKNTEVEVVNLREFNVPIYGIDQENSTGIPRSIFILKEKLQSASGFIIASPEHNGSMPAFFKNIIDWLSRIDQNIFNNKPTILFSASPGANGGKTNLAHLAKLMPFWGAEVIETFSIGNFNRYQINDSLSLPKVIQTHLQKAIMGLENHVCDACLADIY
ncbi:MAG TPA: NAD(P)H-dependent oxidoreductase [Sunxiuqinia sp.]|nr:NAD(P)H-dependent oxidoreductase [Sunxiuqinia sp.]